MTLEFFVRAAIVSFAVATVATALAATWKRPASITRQKSIVFGWTLVVVAVALASLVDFSNGCSRMRLDPSEEPLMSADEREQRVYADAVATFGSDDLFVAAVKQADVFSADNLSALHTATLRARRIPNVRSVESLANALEYRYDTALDTIAVSKFFTRPPAEEAGARALKKRALENRLYRSHLISNSGDTTALNISFKSMSDEEFIQQGISQAVAEALAPYDDRNSEVFITGRQHLKAATYHLMISDLLKLIPLAILVGACTGGLYTRSLAYSVIPVSASVIASIVAVAVLSFADLPMNLITLLLGPMLICVGAVYGVHVMARYEALSDQYLERAGEATVIDARLPVLIAGVTTMVGFLALAVTRTPGVRQFGTASAIGVLVVCCLATTFVPALLDSLPERFHATRTRRLNTPALKRIAALVTERPTPVLLAWAFAALGSLALLPRIHIDTDYLTFFNRDSKVRTDFRAISENLVGAVPIYVTVSSEQEGWFRDPENLQTIKQIQTAIADLHDVDHTTSVVDLVETLNRALEKDDPDAETIPTARGEVTELYYLIPKNELRTFLNSNHSDTNILVRTSASGSARVLALEKRIKEVLAGSGLADEINAEVTGNTILVNHSADHIATNQLASVALATLCIFICIATALGNPRLGIVAMIPNVTPVLLFFGLLGAGAAALSIPTGLVGCIALGIAVDDTAHFVVDFSRYREAGLSAVDAAAECVVKLGRPIVATSLMLVAGFFVLGFSNFATLREFGYLAAATMAICLAADLTLLPALLVATSRTPREPVAA